MAAEIRPQLTARRRAINRRREEAEVKNEIVVYSETAEVGMMIVVTSPFHQQLSVSSSHDVAKNVKKAKAYGARRMVLGRWCPGMLLIAAHPNRPLRGRDCRVGIPSVVLHQTDVGGA